MMLDLDGLAEVTRDLNPPWLGATAPWMVSHRAGIIALVNAAPELLRLARLGAVAARYVRLPDDDERITDAYFEMCAEVSAWSKEKNPMLTAFPDAGKPL